METVRTNKSLNFIFTVLTICGFWSPPSFAGTWRATIYGIYSFLMYVATVIVYVITEGMDLYVNLGNMEENTQTALLSISIFSVFIKATKLITGHEGILRIINKLDEPNFTYVTKANSKHLLRAMKRTDMSMKILLGLGILTVLLWSIYPLLDKFEIKLPVRAWYPWDRSIRSTFVMLYIYQVISIFVLTCLNAAQDVLICSIMYLMCGQLEVLYDEIADLGTGNEESAQQNNEMESAKSRKPYEIVSKEQDVNLKLRKCIIHQKDIIDCCEQFEGLFGGVVLIQFIGSCIVICTSAFQLSLMPFNLGFMSIAVYLSTMLFELFLFCYSGNELMIKSALISNAAYNSLWYNQDLTYRKMVIIFMERSKRPIIITAGRILPLTLSTLTSILRSSYSYYAVLRSMHNV